MHAYDPLDYENLARSVVQALLAGPEEPLPPCEPFEGAGVYAMYYRGNFKAYAPLAKADPARPIYVGMAVPSGSRKGGSAPTRGKELCQRLRQHAKTVAQAKNLKPQDFTCRYLVVVPVWITMAERFLVEHYRPVWMRRTSLSCSQEPRRNRCLRSTSRHYLASPVGVSEGE